MNVLILGSGGRESALARAFARDPNVGRILVAPGNSGLHHPLSGLQGRVETLTLPSFEDIARGVREKSIDLVFVGPEKPLSEGVVDFLQAKAIPVIGPTRAAARIESSKSFAKRLCQKAGVPTAEYAVFTDANAARDYLRTATFPIVLKADGLAEGKGVVIAQNLAEAEVAVNAMMSERRFGNSGAMVVIEEFMRGWEASIFAFTDGCDFVSTVFSQDHKPLEEGNLGPNTGGMGAYAPVAPAEIWHDEVNTRIFTPILQALRDEGCPYRGVLYAGLMMTDEGPKVVEFNCRFGDPETEVVLPLLTTPFSEVCNAIVNQRVRDLQLTWSGQSAVTVVLASEGYPNSVKKGLPIEFAPGLQATDRQWIDFAGVSSENGQLTTSGGRVMMCTGLGMPRADAEASAYRLVSEVSFAGMQYRRDIAR